MQERSFRYLTNLEEESQKGVLHAQKFSLPLTGLPFFNKHWWGLQNDHFHQLGHLVPQFLQSPVDEQTNKKAKTSHVLRAKRTTATLPTCTFGRASNLWRRFLHMNTTIRSSGH